VQVSAPAARSQMATDTSDRSQHTEIRGAATKLTVTARVITGEQQRPQPTNLPGLGDHRLAAL